MLAVSLTVGWLAIATATAGKASATVAVPDVTGWYRVNDASFHSTGGSQFPYSLTNQAGGNIRPFAGDFDGSGKDVTGWYRVSDASFHANAPGFPFSLANQAGADIWPFAGDFDGNGTDTVGWYRVSDASFHANAAGFPYSLANQAGNDIRPFAGDFDGNGTDTVGWYRVSDASFHANAPGFPYVIANQAGVNIYPFSGHWAGTCDSTNSCTPQQFSDALLSYPGVDAPVTSANEHAIETWARLEGGGAGCPGQPAHTAPWPNSGGPAGNPLNTTRAEPGSTNWNGIGVQIYHDSSGQTCWYWGIRATGDSLTNGLYDNIISVLDNPSADPVTQCKNVSSAVAASPWGTPSFSSLC
jgi:hypothetical protein